MTRGELIEPAPNLLIGIRWLRMMFFPGSSDIRATSPVDCLWELLENRYRGDARNAVQITVSVTDVYSIAAAVYGI